MEGPLTGSPEVASNKLTSVEISVAEIDPESPALEFDRLSVQSPIPQPIPTLVTRKHHHNLPRASSPTGSVRSSFTSHRHVSRGHWSSGFTHSHRSEASNKLTAQAESEFLSLMDLISGISRRSSSLKDVWTKIISERESCFWEMERMSERFQEYTETIERKHQHHQHENESQQKEVNKLRLEITAASSSVSEYKKKLSERDRELADARREVSEYKDNFKYLKEEHEETKKTLEETHLRLVASEEAFRKLEEDAKMRHSEHRTLKYQYLELQTSYSELTSKYESTHKEVLSLKQSNATLKKEKHEWLHEKAELEEDLRKCHHRNDEQKRKFEGLTDSYEKSVREVHKLQEIISKMKHESEELHLKSKELKQQLEEEHSRRQNAEDKCSKWKLKWEDSEREIISIREEVRVIEIEQNELRETITKKAEELRHIIFEKERMEEAYHDACGKAEENHRQILILQESLRRTESTLKEKNEVFHALNERIERIEYERDEARSKSDDLSIEISQLQSSVVSLKLEIETVTKDRDGICERLRDCETKYEEIYESFTEYEEGNNETEYEISNLRTMLREVREQKEKAITMRTSADQERDEAIMRYEEKCRELEKMEEKLSHYFHSHGRSGGRTSVQRSFIRNAGTGHNHESEYGDEAETITSNGIVEVQ